MGTSGPLPYIRAPLLRDRPRSAFPGHPDQGHNARARSALLTTAPTGVRPTQLGLWTVNRDTSLGVGQTLKALETLAHMVLIQAVIPVILVVPPLAPTVLPPRTLPRRPPARTDLLPSKALDPCRMGFGR